MKLKLLASDFEEEWISFKVPHDVFKKMHFHPCEIEVDITQLQDDHSIIPYIKTEKGE